MAQADFTRDKKTGSIGLELELTSRELSILLRALERYNPGGQDERITRELTEVIWQATVYQRPCPEDLLEFHREMENN
jgi:hypothetical protein